VVFRSFVGCDLSVFYIAFREGLCSLVVGDLFAWWFGDVGV